MRQIRFRNFKNYFDPFFVFENNFRFEKLFLMPKTSKCKYLNTIFLMDRH